MCHIFPTLKNSSFFSTKKNFFFKKTQSLYFLVEKSYYFISILRQICYNLVMKNFQFRTAGNFLLSSKGKNTLIEWIIFHV